MAGVLLTGATGNLGSELVKANLRAKAGPLYTLLRGSGPEVREKYETLKKEAANEGISDKVFQELVIPVKGDIGKNALGMTKADFHKVSENITGAIHCAADVNFSTTIMDSVDTNLVGTKNLLIFLSKCGNLEKFGHVSTAYVSGRRKGLIKEAELEHSEGFTSAYEQSKYLTEIFLRSNCSVPTAVYRPTIIICNSRGVVKRFSAIHYGIKLYYHNLLKYLPGEGSSTLNMITSDFAAGAITRLFKKFRPKTYHICAPLDGALTLSEFLKETEAGLKEFGVDKNIASPKISSLQEYDEIMKNAAGIRKEIMASVRKFSIQLAYPKQFDDFNLRKDLGDKVRCPHFSEYCKNMLAYSISRWKNG